MESNKKTLIDIAVDLYRKELTNQFKKEAAEPEYLNQKDFATVEDRVRTASNLAQEPAIKAMTLAALNHRIKEHGDKRSDELKVAEASVSKAVAAEIKAETWWMGT